MTVEFFGVRGVGQIGGLNKTGATGGTQKTSKSESKEGASFASSLHGAGHVSGPAKAEEAERAARVQALKGQVASGQYDPDLNKVASSLLRFLVDG
ncbi:flagellar biosynthesis anti-sigma factor FlgM [Desulfobulbus oligotrophicus]|jgi:negative regulator of flagellin synthesis FlgM|uniref:Flagellar biosynthesis anti-sigma factor FlgM n=1 Tax=Desulfobulbus oligotrophicus TaxID=1909699 RepID=A0A7T6AQQ9_9BACT|nr:flagellar biosynthesis anti-sigma factor FlgM [Desulfobulbus oligotrophicus]MDY0389346.1 flagellar biosynthesis anti-sigma factor FlgM [Desulfobulbus oligotrophicus]QQG66006.1 flagellar biosynthesis anti-sigma factor FlgM [Desulfobulbus oligotrophicus]